MFNAKRRVFGSSANPLRPGRRRKGLNTEFKGANRRTRRFANTAKGRRAILQMIARNKLSEQVNTLKK